SSHTGALASPDKAVSALFRKAGIIRAYSRGELVNIASILKFPKPKGDRIAIITHAGGPAVMLTDILSSNGIQIPKIAGPKAEELLQKLFPGSSVNNPIDFLATGTAEQLEHIIDACNNDFDVDAMAIIFGSPGLTDVSDVYEVLYKKLQTTKKPIYPILPSIVNAKEAIEKYQAMGGISFNEEVAFGKAFVDTVNTPAPQKDVIQPAVDKQIIRTIIDSCENGYLLPLQVQQILDAAGINRAKEAVVNTIEEALESVHEIGYPIVMKVIGPIHKTDVGGVSLNIADDNTMATEFTRMMTIKDTTAILLQPMLKGTEIFIGAKKEGNFGTIVMCGLGGIFIEALKDVNSELIPIAKEEAQEMIKNLKGYKIIKGIRGLEGVNE
ncbi:MAG: acetate--CoA ligase family protein, partial [Bacteroidales bacterium]